MPQLSILTEMGVFAVRFSARCLRHLTSICKCRLPLILLFGLIGCTTPNPSENITERMGQQFVARFPYHPLVYHLDLSAFAYHLYDQTHIWPFDPYYEGLESQGVDRAEFMARVRKWAKDKGREQTARGTAIGGYRGPGVLNGFQDNASHDPIIYQYSRLYPWSQAPTNFIGKWSVSKTPDKITANIADVHMCYRKTGKGIDAVAIDRLKTANKNKSPRARDILLAFEGGTGDKGEAGRPASQSLMGFVLVRQLPNSDDYDLHIAFRGSSAGSAARAITQAFSDDKAAGNPDWITDLGYKLLKPGEGGEQITTTGAVTRGFSRSIKSIFPQLFACLGKVASLKQGKTPSRIYVTGHSLGGALAQSFVSAILMGNQYGPVGKGSAMPAALQNWPWKNIKLITFSAPRVGNAKWAKTLTEKGLDSEFFSTSIDPVDRKALDPNAAAIVQRLANRDRPAGFRVLISTDPVATEKVLGGKHVGKTVYADNPGLGGKFTVIGAKAHSLHNIRKLLVSSLTDTKIPSPAAPGSKATLANLNRPPDQQPGIAEFEYRAARIRKYSRDNGYWFDQKEFDKNFRLFKKLFQSD